MNIPLLPTDNLYKFMALAGVVLFLFGLSFPLRLAGQLQLMATDVTVQTDISKLRTEQLSGEVRLLEAKSGASLDESKALQSKLYALREQTAILQGQVSKAKVLFYQFLFSAIIGFASAIAGYLLARSGFKLWYIRVQQPADIEATRRDT